MDNNKAEISGSFNFAALMIAGGFLALAAFMPSVQPDNRKRDSLLAALQRGLRDENAIACENAISKLTAEFKNQEDVQGCIIFAVLESLEIFGPEIAYKIIRNIGTSAPGSEMHLAIRDLGQTLPAYSECTSQVRSEAFGVMAKILKKAEIPLAVMDRREVVDLKVTHQDPRRYISPTEFSSRYLEPKPKAFG